MHRESPLGILKRRKVILSGHFVLKSGAHAAEYVNKDALYPHVFDLSALCEELANKFRHDDIDAVVGPAMGGILLSTWTAYHLNRFNRTHVYALYAEKDVVTNDFVITRGYDKLLAGRRTLVVEDVLTTGGSVQKTVAQVRKARGQVVGVGALWNRGQVLASQLGVNRLEALVTQAIETYPSTNCPLCLRNVPINVEVGHGREFLVKNSKV